MTLEHRLREASARCLSLLHFYHQSDQTAATRERMGLEVGLVVGWLMDLEIPPSVTENRVLRPVEAELLSRYGHEAGRQINADFVEAFRSQRMALLSHADGGGMKVLHPQCEGRVE